MFEIYSAENLSFADYVQICQVARTWADAYDRKDKHRLHASLAPEVAVDYAGVVPEWGLKSYKADAFVELWLSPEHLGLRPLATQHLLALPYFKHVSDSEIVVEWQLIASHGRRIPGEDFANPACKIGAQSNHRGYVEHTFIKVKGQWRITRIKPSVLYQPGNFMEIRRPE